MYNLDGGIQFNCRCSKNCNYVCNKNCEIFACALIHIKGTKENLDLTQSKYLK